MEPMSRRIFITKSSVAAAAAGALAFAPGQIAGAVTKAKAASQPDDAAKTLAYTEQATKEMTEPVIAQVHGYCLAGATQLCISTDMIFAAENARIGFPSIPAGAGYVSAFWNWMVGPPWGPGKNPVIVTFSACTGSIGSPRSTASAVAPPATGTSLR